MQGIEVRLHLAPSGLLGEVSTLPGTVAGSYYGFNVTKSEREPIDQIHGFLAAHRLQNGDAGEFVAFIAGLFEVVNCTSVQQRDDVMAKNSTLEIAKSKLFQRLARQLNVKTRVMTTEEIWNDETYWDIFADLIADRSTFSRKSLLQDTLRWYRSAGEAEETLPFGDALASFSVPTSVMKSVGSWPAALLYTPLEVAEARYLSQVYDVNLKIGHMEEQTYDRYIAPFMSIVHLRQPTCLKSSRLRPRTVTPYIDKMRRDPKIRIAFTDTREMIERNLAEHIVDDGHVTTISPAAGELLHPLVDKAVFAAEAARAAGRSIVVKDHSIRSGEALISLFSRGGITFADLRESLPDLLLDYVIGDPKESNAT